MSAAGVMVTILSFLVVLVLLGGGVTLIIISRRRGPSYPSCGRCGYDVTRSVGVVERCPECGTSFLEAGVVPPGRGWRTVPLVLGILLILSVIGCMGTSVTMNMAAHARARSQAQAAAAAARAAQQQAAAEQAATEQEATTDDAAQE